MRTPGSSASWAATYSLATRFMPSRSGVTSAARQAAEFRRLDADREDADADGPVSRLERVSIAARHATFAAQVAREIGGVDVGLKAHEVVVAHRRNETFVIGQRGQDFRWRKRDVMKEPDLVPMTEVVEFLRQRKQVVIMDPHDIVRLEQLV